jgi:hypothetical protein
MTAKGEGVTPLNPSTPTLTILSISGSPRPKANSRFLLALALQAAAKAGGDRKDSLRKLVEAGDRDAQVTVRASIPLGRRVSQMALLIRARGMAHRAELEADGGYSSILDRLPPAAGRAPQGQVKGNAAQLLTDVDEIGG